MMERVMKPTVYAPALTVTTLAGCSSLDSGDAALSGARQDVSASGTQDLVVMHDIVHGEPQPQP
jgi:outer membrane murein-binding lipoprotein Lpp